MHKTRNLFRAKTAQKGFRVSVFALFLCTSCYHIFILQQPLVFLQDKTKLRTNRTGRIAEIFTVFRIVNPKRTRIILINGTIICVINFCPIV